MDDWYSSAIEGVTNALNKFGVYLNNLYSTYFETIQNGLTIFVNKFAELALQIAEWSRPYNAIQKLADNQYVFWDYLDEKSIDLILESPNINKSLRKLNLKSNYGETKGIADKCLESTHLNPYKKLFSQSMDAFVDGKCELSVLGFISVIDGLLSDVSCNNTTSVFKRADAILKKIENNEVIDNEDFSILALIISFRNTMESFCQKSDFSKKEPKNLNRHWIMHGRSRRRKTKLDCVKMIRFIYGIILLDEFSRKEAELHNE